MRVTAGRNAAVAAGSVSSPGPQTRRCPDEPYCCTFLPVSNRLKYRALAVPAVLAGIGLFAASTPAGAKSVCRTIRVSTPKQSKVTVTPCQRINVGFQIGTQGEIFPTWGVSSRPAKKILKYVRGGYENTSNTDGTTTQFFLYQAVARGRTTVRFCESTPSIPGCLETYKLQVTVRRARR